MPCISSGAIMQLSISGCFCIKQNGHFKSCLMVIYLAVHWFLASEGVVSMESALPLSDCYALDKENYLYDFTNEVGRELELEGEDSDFVLRFCLDAQNRSDNGYINYGRFSSQSMLNHGVDDADFLQEYNYGDLMHCEHPDNHFTGHTTQVKITCDTCSNGTACKDDFGCICNVTYNHNMCKAKVLAAVNCSRRGPRIFPELSIGFQPRGWEVVRNGITQREYREPFHNFSFGSSQKSVSLYITSAAGFPVDIENTYIQVQPSQGLLVNKAILSIPSAAETLTLVQVDWKCKEFSEQPYEVNIRIPIEGYDPIDFFLSKHCRMHDTHKGTELSILTILEAMSLIILLGVILFGIKYKYKLHEQCKSDSRTTIPLITENIDEVHGQEEGSLEAPDEVALV